SQKFNNLKRVEELLQSQYLRQNELEENELEDAAISGMVTSLNDPYSVYLPQEKAKAFTNYINEEFEVEKEYAGLGVAIQPATNGGLVITEIFKGSPASVSNLQEGDVIIAIDGVDILDLSVSDIVDKIKGEVGTSSVLRIERNGKTLTKSFVRKKIFIENYSTVSSEIKDHILWIKVRSFKSFTSRDFKKILRENITDNSGVRGVIIDLRFNPGGLMNVAQEMLGEVLPDGSIAVRLYDSKELEDIYYVDGSADYTEIPLVVFQNEYSASASEIFSAAIKDYERGDIIGTTSFGKGIAQQLFTLSRGSLKVTTSEFRSPLQNIIHKVGVTPDHEMRNQSDESYFYEAKLRLK
ncbi:TPA: S41 family peptidase, partial [Candidatus Peregrinibacteria bacterium]|nr:S41 family peptidase [Candidatus Peregrinibacteria bacterium]